MKNFEVLNGVESLDLDGYSNTTGQTYDQCVAIANTLQSPNARSIALSSCASLKQQEQQIQDQSKKFNLDPKELAEIAQLAAAAGVSIASLLQKDPEQRALKNVCGRKPVNKKKREDWEKCAMEFYRGNANTFNDPSKDFDNTPPPPQGEGMSTGAKIAIGLGVAAVVGLGVWFVVKKMKKK